MLLDPNRIHSPISRYPKYDRGRSSSRDRSPEQERNSDRSSSRSPEPNYDDRRLAYKQTYRQSPREDHSQFNIEGSISPYRSGDLERRQERRFDRGNGYHDQWDPDPNAPTCAHDAPYRFWDEPTRNFDESSHNWNGPNRKWNVSRTSNYDIWQEYDNGGHRSRLDDFDTRSHERQRPRTPISRNNSFISDRYHMNDIENQENVYSSEQELNFSRHMQDHVNYRFTGDDAGSDRDIENHYYERESRHFDNDYRDIDGNKSYLSPKPDNSDAYVRPHINHNYERDWHHSAPFSSLKLCINSGSKSHESCNCDALHICKYFLLSKCLLSNCSFGHDIYTEHNESILQKYFPQRPTIQHLRFIICKTGNRNETTIPPICKFYNNEGGCKHEKKNNATKCQCLHICKYYVQKNCEFDRGCKRSHDLFSGQSLQILRSYGLQSRNGSRNAHEEMLDLLDKISIDYAGKNTHRQRFDNSKSIKENIKNLSTGQSRSGPDNPITNNSDFVPLPTKPEVSISRYFDFKDDSPRRDARNESEENTMLAKHKHGKKSKRKHRDDSKLSKNKRKKKGQVGQVDVSSTAVKYIGNPCNNVSGSDANLGTNDSRLDSKHGTNNSGPDITLETNDSWPDANLGSNDSGPDTNLGTNDRWPDANLGTNDSGPNDYL